MNPHLARLSPAASVVIFFSILSIGSAQSAPGVINHQGRIAISGINFEGAGHFKFALVDAAGTLKLSGRTTAYQPTVESRALRLRSRCPRVTRGLDEIVRLQPVRYRYKKENPEGLPSNAEHIGFVAQELLESIPEAVSRPGGSEFLQVSNDPVLWAMLNAIKELNSKIEGLNKPHRSPVTKPSGEGIPRMQDALRALQAENEMQASEIASLREKLAAIKAQLPTGSNTP